MIEFYGCKLRKLQVEVEKSKEENKNLRSTLDLIKNKYEALQSQLLSAMHRPVASNSRGDQLQVFKYFCLLIDSCAFWGYLIMSLLAS